jgi:hypothetical protein
MSDSLKDLLARRDVPQEPPEIARIKRFIKDTYDATAKVESRDKSLVISVDNAPLAATLRLQSHQLQELCDTDKRLLIRIA